MIPTTNDYMTDIQNLEANYCRDFVCCGLVLDDLHDLLQHYEEYHVQIEQDLLSDDEFDDQDYSPLSSPSISSIDTIFDDPITIGTKRKFLDEEEHDPFIKRFAYDDDFISQANVLLSNNNSNDKPYKCPVKGCDKAYKNPNGLKYHNQHGHCNNPLNDDESEKPYQCTVTDCNKRYKNLNGLKYHIEHSHINQSLLSSLLTSTHTTFY